MPALLETVVDEQATDAKCCENQAEEDISRVSAVVHDAVALPDGQREHQNHKNEIEGFVHKRSFQRWHLASKNAWWARKDKLTENARAIGIAVDGGSKKQLAFGPDSAARDVGPYLGDAANATDWSDLFKPTAVSKKP